MKRSTTKRQDGSYVCINGEFHNIGEHINKMGQLEDIEEEFGIDLIKLLTAKKVYYYDATTDRIEETNYYIVDFMLKQIEVENNYSIPTRLDFKQYGITWSFTKEKLK